MDYSRSQKGNIMIIVVLLISSIGATVFGLASMTLRNIEITRRFDDYVFAQYAAEAGLEQGLYELRYGAGSLEEERVNLGNNSSFKLEQSDAYTVINRAYLDVGEHIQIDLFDAGRLGCIGCLPESIHVSWEGGGLMRYQHVQFSEGATQWEVEEGSIVELVGGSSPWVINEISADKGYKVRLSPENQAVSNVSIKIYPADNAGGEPLPIPNVVKLESFGVYNDSSHKLQVIVPKYLPVSQLADYVLFVEGDIDKNLR